VLEAPPDIFARVLRLQADLAHHHSMWHRRSLGDLFIVETALFHKAGIIHDDTDYDLIRTVRPTLQLTGV